MTRAVLLRVRHDLPERHPEHGKTHVAFFDGADLWPRRCWSQATFFPSKMEAKQAARDRRPAWFVKPVPDPEGVVA